MPSFRIAVLVAVAAVLWVWQFQNSHEVAGPCIDDPPLNVSLFVPPATTPDNNDDATIIHPCDVFSDTYPQARSRFRQAARALQATYQQVVATEGNNNNKNDKAVVLHSLDIFKDKDNNNNDDDDDNRMYTTDIVVVPGTAPGLVFHSSGVHGIEGYAGSAVQIAALDLLRRALLQQQHHDNRVVSFPTIVLIHAVNPVGMARYRRFNEHNVDLNRNGLRPDEWKSDYVLQHGNRATYEKFSANLFNPQQAPTAWSAGMGYYWQAATAIMRHGLPQLKAAMVRGQYHDATGIIYGGSQRVEPSWELLMQWLQKFLQKRRQQQQDDVENDSRNNSKDICTWIDLHTGLGPFGVDTILMGSVPGMTDAAQHVQATFPEAQHPATSANGNTVAQGYEDVRGSTKDYVQTAFTADQLPLIVTQEFGTLHNVWVGRAMIIENAAYQHLPPDQALDWAKQTTLPAFYPQSRVWRSRILQRGVRVLRQAMERSMQLSLQSS